MAHWLPLAQPPAYPWGSETLTARRASGHHSTADADHCRIRSIATAAAPNTPENEKSSRARRPTAEPSMADGARVHGLCHGSLALPISPMAQWPWGAWLTSPMHEAPRPTRLRSRARAGLSTAFTRWCRRVAQTTVRLLFARTPLAVGLSMQLPIV